MQSIKSNNFLQMQGTSIRLDWQEGRNNTPAWNEICAWCIEQFGLPGNKFMWHATEDCMYFDFFDEKDAIHFMLRWS